MPHHVLKSYRPHPTPSCREVVLPIAEHLGIPPKNVFANTMTWQLDEKGEPVRLKASFWIPAVGASQAHCCPAHTAARRQGSQHPGAAHLPTGLIPPHSCLREAGCTSHLQSAIHLFTAAGVHSHAGL